ncbi:MAG: WHG domain-containing protein [Actinomycetota bacterium]
MPYPAQIDIGSLGVRALEVVEANGWEGWSLRDVATHLEVTPNALYRHVDGKHGLHVLAGGAAADVLFDRIDGVGHSDDPRADVVRLVARYVDFALERPHAYQAFMTAKPEPDHFAYGSWVRLWVAFRAVVAEALPDAADAAAFALWSLVHGAVELARGPARQKAADAGLADAVLAVLDGFAAAGVVASPLPPFMRDLPPSLLQGPTESPT